MTILNVIVLLASVVMISCGNGNSRSREKEFNNFKVFFNDHKEDFSDLFLEVKKLKKISMISSFYENDLYRVGFIKLDQSYSTEYIKKSKFKDFAKIFESDSLLFDRFKFDTLITSFEIHENAVEFEVANQDVYLILTEHNNNLDSLILNDLGINQTSDGLRWLNDSIIYVRKGYHR